MSEVDDKEYKELLDLFRENNLTKYGIDRLYGAIIDRKTKSRLEIERLNNILKNIEKCIDYYAIENDDFSKFYNNEEIEILKIIGSDKE